MLSVQLYWTYGGAWALGYMIFFLPFSIYTTIWFYQRKDVQPIKARQPLLVVLTDVILIGYVVSLCLQRMVGDTYPCLVNLWCSHIGTIVLFNTYLWRCWSLYFTYNLTQTKLENKEVSFFVQNKRYQNPKFLACLSVSVLLVLLIPALVLSVTDSEIKDLYGDNCNRRWADAVLAAYVAIYVLVFVIFAYNMRAVVENFRIKEELKWTGVLAIAAVIPWLVFNGVGKTINTTIFPFSTLFVVIAVSIAFVLSTVWPLYRSIFQQADILTGMENIPEDIDTLTGILSTAAGEDSFKKFLAKEFAVENILFYLEVEEFRRSTKKAADAGLKDDEGSLRELQGLAQRIHSKYILPDSPFQINLPDAVVERLTEDLKTEFRPNFERPPLMDRPNSRGDALDDNKALKDSYGIRTPPTLFDAAQKNIFNLMVTDSLPRYFRSDQYKSLADQTESMRKKKVVLEEMKIM